MGLSFANRRSFATIDPGYVRWTQWIFSRIYDAWYDKDATNPSGSKGCARPISTLVEQFESGKRAIPGFEGKAWADLSEAEQADVLNDFRLAYISKSPVNWCPGGQVAQRVADVQALAGRVREHVHREIGRAAFGVMALAVLQVAVDVGGPEGAFVIPDLLPFLFDALRQLRVVAERRFGGFVRLRLRAFLSVTHNA